MLLLITNYKEKIGFFSRRKADKGKLPPQLTGTVLGGYPAVRLALLGRSLTCNLPYLAPYRNRGDILVADRQKEERLGVNQPLIREYARRQCVNLVLEAIKATPLKKRPQIALIDPLGECVGVAAELLAVCDTLTVTTPRPELFAPCAAYTMETFGTRPLFGEVPPTAHLILAPYGCQGATLPAGIPVISPEGTFFPRPEELYVPPWIAGQLSEEFDPVAVTAGVFEAFHPPELMTALPHSTVDVLGFLGFRVGTEAHPYEIT